MTVLGKRRRCASEPIFPSINHSSLSPAPGLPLTQANLRAHAPIRGDGDDFSFDPPLSTRSAMTGTSSQPADWVMRETLQMHNITMNSDSRVPNDVDSLIQKITTTVAPNQTPDAKKIKALAARVARLPEKDALRALDDLLGFPDEVLDDPGGDTGRAKGIRRTYDRQWRDGCIPIPRGSNENEQQAIQETLKNYARLSRPKPDVEYGYTDALWKQWGCAKLPQTLWPAFRAPWLPWLIIEWKSQAFGTNMFQAENQVLRDGAAAVNLMHDFWTHISGRDANHVSRSAVFLGACDTLERFKLFICYRRTDEDGVIHWECREVMRGDLDSFEQMRRMRSALVNIREWAMGDRARIIQQAMEPFRTQSTSSIKDSGYGSGSLITAEDQSSSSSPNEPSQKKVKR